MQRHAIDYKGLAKKYIQNLTDLSDIFSPERPYYFGGHARDAGGEGFEFNIKIHQNIDLPEGISDADFEGQLQIDLQSFMEDIKNRYGWVKNVTTAGRSGGWLIVTPDSGVFNWDVTFKDLEKIAAGEMDEEDAQEWLAEAKKTIQMLTKVQDDLMGIKAEIKNTASAMFEEYEKKEFWGERESGRKQAAAPTDAQRAFEDEIFPRLIAPIMEKAKRDVQNAMIPISEGKWPTTAIEYAVVRHRDTRKTQEQFIEDILDAFTDWAGTINW